MPQEVERYNKRARVLHWVHAGAFILLFLTGLVLFIPQLGFLAEDSWTRLIHRVGAAVFVIIPLFHLLTNWKASWRSIKEAFTWSSQDMEWLRAAPAYYFLNDESAMPPQPKKNSGQKLWWLMVLVFGVMFFITGSVMWFAKTSAPPAVLQWMVFTHDVAFIATVSMFLVHIYLAVLHPLMTEAWGSMVNGKVSAEYAKAHHGKWYDEISKRKEAGK